MKKKAFNLKRMTLIAILSRLCIVLRIWLVAFPNVKPITAIILIVALYFGVSDSFIIAALTMIITGFIEGISPIIIGQIIAYGIIVFIFLAICRFIKYTSLRAILAGILAFFYGGIVDMFSGYFYGFGTGNYIGYWLAGVYYDLVHAVSTVLFYPVILLVLKLALPKSLDYE